MGFNVEGENDAWAQGYQAIWWRICDILDIDSVAAIRNGYVNAKLITWDGKIRTGFQGTCPNPEDIGFCVATGILKIGSVYRQGSNCHLQVFLKECRYKERDVIFKSLLSDDDDDEGYDTIHWRLRTICEDQLFTNTHRRAAVRILRGIDRLGSGSGGDFG